jgi:hypothetical protein
VTDHIFYLLSISCFIVYGLLSNDTKISTQRKIKHLSNHKTTWHTVLGHLSVKMTTRFAKKQLYEEASPFIHTWRALSDYFMRHKITSLNKKSTQEEVTFSHTWRALSGYFLRHKITSLNRKKHTGGANFVPREITLNRRK